MGVIDEAMNAVIAIYKIYRGKREKEESMLFVYGVAIGILSVSYTHLPLPTTPYV